MHSTGFAFGIPHETLDTPHQNLFKTITLTKNQLYMFEEDYLEFALKN
jgi:hypothetical protein